MHEYLEPLLYETFHGLKSIHGISVGYDAFSLSVQMRVSLSENCRPESGKSVIIVRLQIVSSLNGVVDFPDRGSVGDDDLSWGNANNWSITMVECQHRLMEITPFK